MHYSAIHTFKKHFIYKLNISSKQFYAEANKEYY